MSVLYIGEVSRDGTRIEVLCEACKRPVGVLSRAECSELTVAGVRVYCFDCDEIVASEVPQSLVLTPGEMLLIESPKEKAVCAFLVDRDYTYHLEGCFDLESGLRLSSSTYFPKMPQERNKRVRK